MAAGLPNGGFGFHYGAETIGAFYIPVGPGRTLLQLQLIRDLCATVLTAIATYPIRLIEAAREENFVFRGTKLRGGIFGSAMSSDELRKKTKRKWASSHSTMCWRPGASCLKAPRKS